MVCADPDVAFTTSKALTEHGVPALPEAKKEPDNSVAVLAPTVTVHVGSLFVFIATRTMHLFVADTGWIVQTDVPPVTMLPLAPMIELVPKPCVATETASSATAMSQFGDRKY